VGPVSQREFVNAVAEISWRGTPELLLAELKAIERRLGRVLRVSGGPREIDIDILDLGGRIRTRRDPLLPHPRLSSRRFALAPLAEIAPSWRHPVTGRTAAAMMERLPARPGVRRMRKRN
jgi:2-amino-4-hydroxy-6-hydroxymethyldihydropteridine diphosphokinase